MQVGFRSQNCSPKPTDAASCRPCFHVRALFVRELVAYKRRAEAAASAATTMMGGYVSNFKASLTQYYALRVAEGPGGGGVVAASQPAVLNRSYLRTKRASLSLSSHGTLKDLVGKLFRLRPHKYVYALPYTHTRTHAHTHVRVTYIDSHGM